LEELQAIGVGTGPGAFTSLRIGLATAKTLAWDRCLPIVGIGSATALRRAAARAAGIDEDAVTMLQPAGAHDRYLTLPHEAPRLVTRDADLDAASRGTLLVAVDVEPDTVDARAPTGTPSAALARGEDAVRGLGRSLAELLDERLAAGATDEAASLVPAYVALPRGVATSAEGLGWSPALR
jgi:tRNA A37 threonylcarbamoyladenosine modification protein TsaB